MAWKHRTLTADIPLSINWSAQRSRDGEKEEKQQQPKCKLLFIAILQSITTSVRIALPFLHVCGT